MPNDKFDIIQVIIIFCILLIMYKIGLIYISKDNDLKILSQCKNTQTHDGSSFCVQKFDNTDDNTQQAANLLSDLNQSMLVLMRVLKKKYANTNTHITIHGIDLNVSEMVNTLLQYYNQDNLIENIGHRGSTSYTIDKGSLTGICLRNSKNEFIPLNELIMVTCHEISHYIIKDIEHTPKFWATFTFILTEASQCIYKPVNYALHPFDYCGLLVNSSPI